MGIYERLGVKRIVNAAGTLTRLGGSIMPPEVRQAMLEAAESYVDLIDMQRAVSGRIAELTHNEAAYVPSGAAAGLTLITAALITGTDEAKSRRLPLPDGPNYDVLIHKSQRTVYDYPVRQVGVNLVEFGLGSSRTQPWELETAYTEHTLAVIYYTGAPKERYALPLEHVIKSAHARGIPVIVDAAAQLPPVENLWHYTRDLGADVAVFSGGKGLCGPQPTGLVLGRRDIIEGIYVNANPNHGIGRPMKVGKEELAGILAAVERYLRLDHQAVLAHYEEVTKYFIQELDGLPGVGVRREFPSEAGQPFPGAEVIFDERVLGFGRDHVVQALLDGEPSIAVGTTILGIYLNPQTLQEEEERVIAQRIKAIVGRPDRR
jgi:L-seryl-tRNA(Ser) seleniumtransferase